MSLSAMGEEEAEGQATVQYGIIGVGMMGREHMLNLYHLRHQGAAVVSVADPHIPSQQSALQLSQSLGWPIQVFSGHEELLDSGLCEVVIISSPNMTHYQILMDVIAHPKPHNVLVEKPLCTTVAHCKEVNNWNRFNVNTGGTLVEKCCHFFDLMRLFSGANPVQVMASGAMDVNHRHEVYDGKVPDIIDNAYVIVQFDNGSRGMLDLCMFAEGSKNEQEISVVGEIGKGEAFVPEGIVRFGTREAGSQGVKTIKTADERIKYDGLHHGSSYLEHLNFLQAVRIRGLKAPEVDLNDGLVSVAIGVAAQVSIKQGRVVAMEQVLNGSLN